MGRACRFLPKGPKGSCGGGGERRVLVWVSRLDKRAVFSSRVGLDPLRIDGTAKGI